MKKLILSTLFIAVYIFGTAQYQLEWQNHLGDGSSTVVFSQNYDDGILLCSRSFNNSRELFQTFIITGDGSEKWRFDWSDIYPNHSIRLFSINNRDSILFIAQKPGVDSFDLGLFVAELGLSWSISAPGIQETGHLAERAVSILSDGFALLSHKNDPPKVKFYNFESHLIWEDTLNASSFHVSTNTVNDRFYIISEEYRYTYSTSGRIETLRISNDLSEDFIQPYLTKIRVDENGLLHIIKWTPDRYTYRVFDERLMLVYGDSLGTPCPSFGDWKLFLGQGLNRSSILGGLEVCDSTVEITSSFVSYQNGIKNWHKTTHGSTNAMQIESDKIFYVNAQGFGVLHLLDGSTYWSHSVDTLSFFNDYINSSIIVDVENDNFYVLGKSFGPDNKLVVLKYANTETSVKENSHKNDIRLFPNPFSECLIFSKEVRHISLYNAQGVKMLELDVNAKQLKLNQIPPGVYFIQVDERIVRPIIKLP